MLIAFSKLIANMSRNTGLNSTRTNCNQDEACIHERLHVPHAGFWAQIHECQRTMTKTVHQADKQNSFVLAPKYISNHRANNGEKVGALP